MFSGRRGVHCWVCDKIARHLTNKNRNAVAEYLNLFSANRVNIGGDRMHHSMKRAYQIVDAHFDDICLNDQNIFGTVDGRKKLIDLVADDALRKELEPKVNAIELNDSKTVWDLVKRHCSAHRKKKFLVEEIQMSMLCPRLDITVSKGANHLLKAPFCVHPKTGKICVPFNAAAVNKFDPTTVPTLRQVLKEIDEYDQKNKENAEDFENNEKKQKILVN